MDVVNAMAQNIYHVPLPARKHDPTKPLSVVCAGMLRSGTVSLSKALTILGIGPVYHGAQLTARHQHIPNRKVLKHNAEFIDTIPGGYQTISDLPGANFAIELAEAYPDAKVIMNARDIDAWHRSLSESLAFYVNGPHWFEYSNKEAFWMRRYCDRNFQRMFDHNFKKNGKRVYGEHTKHALESIPKERLLKMESGRGMGTFVQVSGKADSRRTFSVRNTSLEMIKRRNMMTDKLRKDALRKVAIGTAVLTGTVAVLFQGWRKL